MERAGTNSVVPCGTGDGGTRLCGKVVEREEQNGGRAREVRVRGGGAERSSGARAGIPRSRNLARHPRDLACSGFPLLCVASSPSSSHPDEGLCVLSGHLRFEGTRPSGPGVCVPYPGLAGEAGGSPTPEEVGGGAGDLCAAAQLPFRKPAGKESRRAFPVWLHAMCVGGRGSRIDHEGHCGGGFSGGVFGGAVEDAGNISGRDVPTAASGARVVREECEGPRRPPGLWFSAWEETTSGLGLGSPGERQGGIERRGVCGAVAVCATVCLWGSPRF